MKTLARLAPLMLAAASLAVGCATPKKPMAAPPVMKPAAEVLDATKADYAMSAPNAKLASVTDFDADDNWLSLGGAGVAAGDFPVGAYVSVVDQNSTGIVLGHGKVRQSADGAIYAEYFKEGDGKRAPMAGDVAVKF